MTGTEMVDLTRYLLQEAEEKFFAQAMIITSLNVFLKRYGVKLANSSPDYYFRRLTHTLTADSNTFDLPNGVLYGNAPAATTVGVYAVFYDDCKYPMEIGDKRYFDDDRGEPTEYCIKGNKIYFDGIAQAGRVVTIDYWHLPTKITVANLADEVDFPDEHAAIIVYEAVLLAFVRSGEDMSQIHALKSEALKDFQACLQPRERTHGKSQGTPYDGGN